MRRGATHARGRPAPRWRLAPLAAAVALLAGCSSPASSGTQPVLTTRAVHGLGRVLVDGAGRTLYLYTPDRRGRSECYGICAVDWPPLLAPSGTGPLRLGRGVERTLVGTVRRRSGAEQLTYAGWPLYLYKFDDAPGEANGEEEDMGLWQVLSPSGRAIT